MKKIFITLFLSVFCVNVFAQTGIGTTTPNASAKLDVFATNKGFLPPRVTLTSVTDVTTIPAPAEGLLVYNVGSVGLQAGYYYWNGANWATIATATSAGNGVTASDMVKLYDGVGNAATINSTGVPFSVTTSGKYLFDFSTSATCGNCNLTLNFQVRDGSNSNAVIASDMQTSYSNNVHAEYNGKVEANLIAGRSYNVIVTASSGGIYNNDYTRVYMKQVSGNLPVTGQTVDYISVIRTTSQTVNTGDNIFFNSINGGNIPYNSGTGNFTLTAGKTYRLTGSVSLDGSNAGSSEIDIAWKNAAGDVLGNRALILSTNYASSAAGNGVTDIVYTPTANTTVSLFVTFATSNAKTVGNFTYANIQQIGSSAIVNPWTLAGTNTYNTTGNVGIGNSAPTTTLDVTGTGKFSTSLINSGTRTYFGKDGGNMHWFATTDAIGEANNLGYGFESNGTSIQSHRWNVGGTQRMHLSNSGRLGLGIASPGTSIHIENGNSFGADPSNTTSPSAYIYNNNNASSSAHSSLAIRTNGSGGGNPYLSFDINGFRGLSMGLDNADGDKFKIQNNWGFSNASTPVITITSDNRVGIGTTNPAAPLHVGSNVTQTVGAYGYLAWNGSTGANSVTQTINYSIQTDERIRAPEFNAISDARIKRDILKLNTANQLTELNKLKVVDYAYIDKLVNGNKHKTGFIAQEVEQVNPQFVNHSTDFIPSVFGLAKSVHLSNAILQVTTEKAHGFVKGDLVKFFLEGKKEIIKSIESVADQSTFSVTGWNEGTNNLFIYGKKVTDFRAIDFDQITALSVAAIQELSKQIEKLKAENVNLKLELTNQLKAKQAEFENRLLKLENKVNQP